MARPKKVEPTKPVVVEESHLTGFEPTGDLALDSARTKGFFTTTDEEEVKALIAKGFQPTGRDGAKPYRNADLFIFAVSEEKAKELIYG